MADVAQVFIVVLGMTSALLVSTKGKYQRWGYVVGLMSQPFWLFITYHNKQYGMFAMAIFYTCTWINGIVNHFGMKTSKRG